MFSSLDILYFTASICLVAITVAILILTVQALGILRDINRISQNVEEIALLVEKVAQVSFPGIISMAKSVEKAEKKVGKFISDKADLISKI